MYPLKYSTGEVICSGDSIRWTDCEGNVRHGEISQVLYQNIPGGDGSNSLEWSTATSNGVGNISLAGPFPPKSLRGTFLLLEERVQHEVPWERIFFERRSETLAYYYTGEPVRNGDFVAFDQGDTMIICRMQIFLAKSDIEYWMEGDIVMISLNAEPPQTGGFIFPYLDEETETPHSSWQDVYFVRRGNWPVKGIAPYVPLHEMPEQ